MGKNRKPNRLKPRLPRGFADSAPAEIRATQTMLATITDVYELYGFDPIETPAIEFTEALGKFLPDQDRPNEGVFSFQDDDEQWLSLRYDLTAPLARYVAEHYDSLAKPHRSYRLGQVFRNEKPGPGRFRQFTQFDADTVGAASVAADAEICMMTADTLERLGIARSDFVVRVNNRKILDGIMEISGLAGDEQAATRLTVLRAIDKLDRLGAEGVELLLGDGRRDESGDFTKGAGLTPEVRAKILQFVGAGADGDAATLANLGQLVEGSETGQEGVDELARMSALTAAAGYDDGRVMIDPSVVRGLEYYTGPVFEAELTFEILADDGRAIRFGSVAGGGRYDGLVGRFRAQDVPATGISIGVSRLAAALERLRTGEQTQTDGPVVVLVMDRDRIGDYQKMVADLRAANIRAEMYLGESGMKAQMKYADRRQAPCVVIQGSDEREAGTVQIKDLVEGLRQSRDIDDNVTWRESRPAQITVDQSEIVNSVRTILDQQAADTNDG